MKLGSAESEAWSDALTEHQGMSIDDQIKWEDKARTYPAIESLVCKPKRERPVTAGVR